MFELNCLDRRTIRNEGAGLTEPSGLALTPDGDGLWTVSDDTKRVFYLSSNGDLDEGRSFDVRYKGLEGITTDETGRYLFTVREKKNRVLKLAAADGTEVENRRLSDMDGYAPMKRYFADDRDDNKGLEGITWNTHTETLFALKEGKPGLFIEIAPDLNRILGFAFLGPHNGFVDERPNAKKVDFSGICYDPSRKLYWIVSHQAQRVFLYSRGADRVVDQAVLGYTANGRTERIQQAEGVAVDAATNRLYVVGDRSAQLFTYEFAL